MAKADNGVLYFDDALTDVQASGGDPKWPLGTLRMEGGKVYRFMLYDDGTANIASVANQLVYHVDGAFKVTRDISDSSRNEVAGMALAAMTDGQRGWVQVRGRASALVTDGGGATVRGDFLISANADGTSTRMIAGTASTHKVVAVAHAAESGSAVDAFLLIE